MAAPDAGGRTPGMVPIKIKTPSGKTAILYASAVPNPAPSAGAATPQQPGSAAPSPAPQPQSRTDSPVQASGHQEAPQAAPEAGPGDATGAEQGDEGQEGAADDGGGEPVPCAQVPPQEPASSEFRVGDIVYRHGELASVAHVDYSLDPPGYVVRMAQTGQEVSCERQHLIAAFPQTAQAQASQASLDAQMGGQQVGAATYGYAGQPPAAFADMVQMQYMQQMQQLQQMQQMQPLDEMQQMQYMQQMQQMQQAYMPPIQEMQQFSEQTEPATSFQPSDMTDMQQQMPWAAYGGGDQGLAHMAGEQAHHMYQVQGAQQQAQMYPGGATDTTFADAVQMQQYMMQPQAPQYAYAGQAGPVSAYAGQTGPVKNHALEALTAALDRAEVGMLLGGKKQSHPLAVDDFDLGRGDFAMRQGSVPGAGDLSGNQGPTNFALQAAMEALGGAGTPRGGYQPSAPSQYVPSAPSQYAPSAPSQYMPQGYPDSMFASHMPPAHAPPHAPLHAEAAQLPAHVEHARVPMQQGPGPSGTSAPGSGGAFPEHLGRGPPPGHPAGDRPQQQAPAEFPEPPPQIAHDVPGSRRQHRESPPIPISREGSKISSSPRHLDLESFRCSPSPTNFEDDDDDELELMARQEMDEDDIIDFSRRIPPKPPMAEVAARPPLMTVPPAIPPLTLKAEKPPKQRSHSRHKKEQKEKQRLEKRDFLVDCVINDGVPSRSTTPRKHRDTSRSMSRGPPPLPGGMRSLSTDHEPSAHSASPSKPVTPRNGGQPPSLFKGNTKKSDKGCVASLPQLGKLVGNEKTQRAMIASGSQSARSWRSKAGVGLYA